MNYSAITVTPGEDCIKITSENGCCVAILAQNAPVVTIGGGTCVVLGAGPGGTVDYGTYLAGLPLYPNEAAAAADGLVSGDAFRWSTDTDVGIAGDLHIML